MRLFLITCFLLLAAAGTAPASDWPDATPTAWHQLARAESLLSAPEPPNPVAVCIVDSGVNLTPDLAPVVIERLAYDGGDPGDTYPQEGIDDGHGTYVATFLAGQVNGWGGAGLWPRAKIVSVRVFPPGGKRANVYDYIAGLRICRQRSLVRVINLSLGDIDGTPQELRELEDAVAEYRLRDGLNIVAAAGNRGGEVEIPARFPHVFAVGSADVDGELCNLSARGDSLDVIAPGCGLRSADTNGNPALFSGSSFASPLVAAVLAALRAYGNHSAEEAEQVLLRTSRPVSGGRLVDVRAALYEAGVVVGGGPHLGAKEPPTRMVMAPRALPRPRAAAYWRSHRLTLRLKNRPGRSTTRVAIGRRLFDSRRVLVRLRVRRRPDSVRLRYLNDDNFSEWTKLRVIRHPG